MPQSLVKPSNQIYVAGPYVVREVEVGANATAAKMIPGILVIHDTTDGNVKEAGDEADNVLGVLDVKTGQLYTTAYAVGDQAKIFTQPGTIVVVTLASGGTAVAPGDPIVAAADGKAKKQAVGAMGSQGSVIGRAMETQDPTAADKRLMIRLEFGSEPAAAA